MFPVKRDGRFGLCPDHDTCQLRPCLFEHDPKVKAVAPAGAPPLPASSSIASASSSSSVIPALKSALKKRPPSDATLAPPLKQAKVAVTTTTKLVQVPSTSSRTSSTRAVAPPSSSNSSSAASTSKVGNKTPGIPTSSYGTTSGPPRISPSSGAVHTAHNVRQKLLDTLFEQFLQNYSSLPSPAVAFLLASKHAKEQEQILFSKTNKATYRNGVISALARLKKRPAPTTEAETGTLEDDVARAKAREEDFKGRLTRERVSKFVHDKETLRRFDYVVDVPEGPGSNEPTEEGNRRKCDRCGTEFTVVSDLTEADCRACSFHFGRMITEKQGGIRQRVWSCCPTPGAATCSQGPHVFRDSATDVLHSRIGFIETSEFAATSRATPALDIVALDCELVYTTSGMSLARLTVVDSTGAVILDEHIRPQGAILDLNTRFSGVKEGDIEQATLNVAGVRKALGMLVDERTVVVGHGLENDLKALRWVHLSVIDTAILFPHPNGGTWRHSLRNLTKDILGKFIQDSDPALGHSSVDDSQAALELVRWKVKEHTRLGK